MYALNKTQHKVCWVFIIAYLGWGLKSMSQISQYLFIAILCEKILCVNWALGGQYISDKA